MKLRLITKNKKAQGGFIVWIFVIVVLLGASLFFIILNKAWGEMKTPLNEGLLASLPADSGINITKTLDQTTSTTLAFDKLIPFLLIGLFAFVLITAGALMDHPIMIFVGIIILGVVILLAVIYSNVYNELTSTEEFSATKAQFPISDKFMQYLPFIVFIMAIGIVAAIIWGKKTGGGGGL